LESDWPELKVADLQRKGWLLVEDGNHGEYRPRPNEFGTGETAFIRAADMEGGRVLFESAQRINETARERISKGIGAPGDVLISHKGTVGKVARVPEEAPPFVCSPQTTFWRVLDPRRVDRRYLYCLLRSNGFRRQLDSRKGETDMADYVSLTAQRELKISVPPIEVQRGIGNVLGALDDKIEQNRRMNRTLEAMAKAIFKSWFVDFDPVVAKADGRTPYGMDNETAALFPKGFQDAAIGLIPQGWTIAPIGELLNVFGGSTPSTNEPSYWVGGTIPWATPKDLAGLSDPVLTRTARQITEVGLTQISSGLLPSGTVLMSSRAPIGYIAISETPVSINQGFIGMVCDGTLSNHYVVQWLKENMDTILGRSNGTTFLEISKANFRPIPALKPSEQVLQRFAELAGGLHLLRVKNIRQSDSLRILRDTLLPKFLSGEIRLADAEQAVGEVV